jgi:hypothetical protein
MNVNSPDLAFFREGPSATTAGAGVSGSDDDSER